MSERLHLQLGPADLRVTYELLIYIYIYKNICENSCTDLYGSFEDVA